MATEVFKLVGSVTLDGLKNVNKGLDDVTGKTGKTESSMVKSFKKIGGAVAGAFAVKKLVDFGSQAVKLSAEFEALDSQFSQVFGDLEQQATDTMNALAKTTGVLPQRLKPAFAQISSFAKTTGMDTEESLDLTARAMAVATDSAAFYDRSIEDVTASLQSFLKGNYENDAALGISATETTRNAKANELYGKSFKDLDEAQKQLTLLAMVEEGNELSGALGQASREADGLENVTGNLQSAWETFMATLGKPILALTIPIMKGLTSVIQGATKGVQSFFDAFSDTDTVIGGFVQRIGSIWGEITNLFDTGGIGLVFSYLKMQLPRWIEAGQEIFTGILQGIQDNLPMILETVSSFLQTWITGLSTFYPMILEIALQLLNGLIMGITENLPMIIQTVVALIITITQMITENLPLLIQGAIVLLQGIIQGILENLPMILDTIIFLLNTVVNLIVENLPLILDAGMQILNALVEGITILLPKILESGITLLLALINGVIGMLPQLMPMVITLILTIVNAVIKNLPMIITAGIQILLAVISGLIKAIPTLVKSIPTIIKAIFTAFGKVDWLQLGKDIISGLWNGIVSLDKWIRDKVSGFVRGIGSTIKSFFGIKSPSTWMRDEIGKFLPQGMAIGIEAEAKEPIKAVAEVGEEVKEESKNALTDNMGSLFDNPAFALANQVPQVEGRGGEIIVPLYVDGKEFARAVAPNVDRELERGRRISNRGRGMVF